MHDLVPYQRVHVIGAGPPAQRAVVTPSDTRKRVGSATFCVSTLASGAASSRPPSSSNSASADRMTVEFTSVIQGILVQYSPLVNFNLQRRGRK